jgi:hypothetical protein
MNRKQWAGHRLRMDYFRIREEVVVGLFYVHTVYIE